MFREALVPEATVTRDPFLLAVEEDIHGRARPDQLELLMADPLRWKDELGSLIQVTDLRLGTLEPDDKARRARMTHFKTCVMRRLPYVKALTRQQIERSLRNRLNAAEAILVRAAAILTSDTREHTEWRSRLDQYLTDYREGHALTDKEEEKDASS